MPRIVDFDLRDFGTDPYGQGERFVERRFDEFLELGECQVVLHDDKDSESREKTGTCSRFSEAPPIFCEDSKRQGQSCGLRRKDCRITSDLEQR